MLSSNDSSPSPPAEKKQKIGTDSTDSDSGRERPRERSSEESHPHPYYNSDDERELNDVEFYEYTAAVRASDGFDVPCFPGVYACGMITPCPDTEYVRRGLRPYCLLALEHYNQQQETDYVFERVEKANAQSVRGIKYYITFVARSSNPNTTKTFQAVVFSGIPKNKGDDPTEVEFCREKAGPS